MAKQNLPQPLKNNPKANNSHPFWKSERAILMVCISIAFIFWLFTKLSYVYRSTLSVEVAYSIPADKVLTIPPPSSIEISVEASGWDLLRLHFSSKKYLIDVDLADNAPKTINASAIKGKIAKQLLDGVTVLEITPDAIQFLPEALATKEIYIYLDNQIELAAQYKFKDSVHVQPQVVQISGPASVVGEIKSWTTVPLIMQGVETNFTKKVDIKPHPNSNVKFSPNKVIVEGKVEQVTEKKLEIEIERRAVPDSILLVLLPQKVTLSCIVGLSDYDDLSADQFTVVADFSKINLYEQSDIRIELEDFPDFVNFIQIQPKKVDYIIRSQTSDKKNGK